MRPAHRKVRTLLAASTAIVTAVTLVACGGGAKKTSTTAKVPSTKGTVSVGAALIGPKNDKSFNQSTYEGILAAEKTYPRLKLTSTIENRTTDALRTDAIRTLAPINKIVVGVSASFGPVLDATAPQFPNTQFFDVTGYTSKYHKNVASGVNDWGVPAYVGGVIAAHITKTGVVGYVGGAEIPPTVQAEKAFTEGVHSVKPSVKVLTNIVGNFDDVSLAKAATTSMLQSNADVIFPFLDSGIAGAYAAGTQSGKNPAMFKLTIPDCTSYSNIVGTEVVNEKALTEKLFQEYMTRTLQPGAVFVDVQDPTLETMQLCPKYQSNPTVAAVTKQTLAGINSGKIKLAADAVNPRPSYPYREGFNGKVINAGKTG
jgi:basic membrane protein A